MGRAKGRSLGWQGRGRGINGRSEVEGRDRGGAEPGGLGGANSCARGGRGAGRAGRDSEEGVEEGPAPGRPGGDAKAGRPRGLSRAPTASFRGPRVLMGT